ncbi:MAG: RtcB family protein [Pseudomonadota bacterium]|nr:RtcB family protein [Pseudomonadota bacterium]
MIPAPRAPLHAWLAGPLPPGVGQAMARLRASPAIARIAVMPDVHLAEGVCVGTVIATRDTLFPEAVGGDIGCGVSTVRLDPDGLDRLDDRAAARILRGLERGVPIQRWSGPRPVPPVILSQTGGPSDFLANRLRRDGAWEFGTLGRGNHFLELQEDDAGGAWLLVHSGSRALGPAVRDHYAALGCRDVSGLAGLSGASEVGRAYRDDVDVLVAWAEASRAAMLGAACAVLEAVLGLVPALDSQVDTAHNHVRHEVIGGEPLWVHRKGACPAHVDEGGVIPGSMGAPTFHTRGRGCVEALCSSSHGAGREMSRSEARARVTGTMLREQVRGVYVPGGDLREEAPSAYKDIEAVLRAQRPLVRIVRRLRPRLVWRG